MAKKSVLTEKEKQLLDLQNRLSEEAKKHKYMDDFMNKWNKSNKEKIQEIVKIQDRIICHFNSYHISFEGKLKLGFKNEKVK